jgi:hypothetical protein
MTARKTDPARARTNAAGNTAEPTVFLPLSPEVGIMANPLAKKNPLLSIWLSAANAWAGAARGMMAAEVRRQQKAAAKATTRPPAKKKRQRPK